MKRILVLAAASLMASSAVTLPALAQDAGAGAETTVEGATPTPLKKKLPEAQVEGGASTEIEGEAQTEGAEGGASAEAEGSVETEGEADTAQDAAPAKPAEDTADTATPSDETTASINVTSEQETELRTVFTEVEVDPIEVDFEIGVGVTVPETIVLHPLPPRIIEIVPDYEGYQYFVLADGTIVIVVPDTHEIVYVIA